MRSQQSAMRRNGQMPADAAPGVFVASRDDTEAKRPPSISRPEVKHAEGADSLLD